MLTRGLVVRQPRFHGGCAGQTAPRPGGWLFKDPGVRMETNFQRLSTGLFAAMNLALNQMADLFQRDKSVISKHVKNVFDEGELKPEPTVAKFATVQNEGRREVSREIEFYNLDVIISVGYRVKSHRGTQFRIWATQRLRAYIVKGFTLDDERLKKGGGDHFDELLERIRAVFCIAGLAHGDRATRTDPTGAAPAETKDANSNTENLPFMPVLLRMVTRCSFACREKMLHRLEE